MFIPARAILFLILYLVLPFSEAQAQLDAPKRISISVQTASNNIERPSGLYLHVYAQEPKQSVSDFIEQEAGASEQALSELIAALKTDDFEHYKIISVGSEKGKKNIFKSFYFTPTGDAVKDLEKSEMLYKLYLGDRIVYVLKVFLPKYNRHFALSLLFSRQNGNYYYESNNKPYPIKEAVSSAFFEQITLRSTSNYIFPYTPQPYNQTLVTGKYPVEAGFSNLWVVNQKLAAASPGAASKSNPEISKIVSFYQTIQQQLKADALDEVFQQMEPKSVERFTGNNTNINIPELAAYVLVMAVPDTIALIIDADPFYIVYGTNFTPKYQEIITMKDKEAQAVALKEMGLSHRFILKQPDGSLKLTHLRSDRFIDRLLQDPHFIDQVVIPALQFPERIAIDHKVATQPMAKNNRVSH